MSGKSELFCITPPPKISRSGDSTTTNVLKAEAM